jgi:hypothetical protein
MLEINSRFLQRHKILIKFPIIKQSAEISVECLMKLRGLIRRDANQESTK